MWFPYQRSRKLKVVYSVYGQRFNLGTSCLYSLISYILIRWRLARGKGNSNSDPVSKCIYSCQRSRGAYVSVGILSNNVWLKSSAIAVISLLVKVLNRCKAKWAAPECRTSVQCDYQDLTVSLPWAQLECSHSVNQVRNISTWYRSLSTALT
jgi:hypothetical protein